ncbi:NUDIX hydrolase [Candidatus Saccharibacteria bacterium]|nr:NUDIX hydrolase [Candidatus Saccharibacteria bacterium]
MKNWEKYLKLAKERPDLFTSEGLEVILDEETIKKYEEETGREIGIVYESKWRYLLVDLVRCSTGKLFAYERVVPTKTGGVAVLPVYHGSIVLIREYRHPIQKWCLEIPRGFGTPGASALQNAAKELYEETGIEECKLVHLGQLNTDTGLTSDQVDLFLADVKELSISLTGKEETEAISHIQIIPFEKVQQMIADGEITDGFTLSALGIWQVTYNN